MNYLDGDTAPEDIPEELARHEITCPNAQETPAEPCARNITERYVQAIRDMEHAVWAERLGVMKRLAAGTITRAEAGAELVTIEERLMVARQTNKDGELEETQMSCCSEASAPGGTRER